jgi:hypothetical protein
VWLTGYPENLPMWDLYRRNALFYLTLEKLQIETAERTLENSPDMFVQDDQDSTIGMLPGNLPDRFRDALLSLGHAFRTVRYRDVQGILKPVTKGTCLALEQVVDSLALPVSVI